MAKSCRAFLVKIEKKNERGDFEPTIYADSLPLAWSCQRPEDDGRPIDLPSGVSQFVDIISTDKVATHYKVHVSPTPFRYNELLFDSRSKILRFTILVTGDGVKAGKVKIVFDWRGKWDTFEVAEG